MKRTIALFSYGIVVLLGLSTPVLARDKACAGDIQKFCSNASSWKDKGSCLKQHEQELSVGCEKKRQERKVKWEAKKAEFHKACDKDIQAHCSNVADAKEKPWEVFKCLKTNENSLSDLCKTEVEKKHGRHHHHA